MTMQNVLSKLNWFFILIFLITSCNGQIDNKNKFIKTKIKPKIEKHFISDLSKLKLYQDTTKNYIEVKNSIKELKLDLANKNKDSLSLIFKQSLLNRIIPFWQGTEWSFEGHTAIPKKGEIACGYFVSTTLRDVGLNINRYHLAQQSPINEAKSLALNTNVIVINEDTKEGNIKKINKLLKDEIYFIGFDSSHVGYIIKEKGDVYIIHSNYLENIVMIEVINKSEVFASFNRFYIVEISSNTKLLNKWLNNEKVPIYKM